MPLKEKKMTKRERKSAGRMQNEEGKCVLLYENLDKEIKYGNVTRRKYERCWKDLVIKTGLERLKDDLEYTWQVFEWALDIKDCYISTLMEELNKAKEQYSVRLQNNSMDIRHLLNNMNGHLKCMCEDFSKSVENIKRHYQQQHDQYQKYFEKRENYMKVALYRMEADQDFSYKDQVTHFFYLKESCKAAENEHESYHLICAKRMEKLWDRSKTVLNDHISRCEAYEASSKKHRIAMELSDTTIRKNLKKMSHYAEVVNKLQDKFSFLFDTDVKELRHTEDTREDFSTYLLLLRDNLFKNNKRFTHQRKLLVCSSETIMDRFRKILEKGEQLLRLMTINRKLETESEKVLEFPARGYHWKQTFSKLDKPSLRDKLFLFYQKIAAADASRLALMEEKKALEMDNMRMQKKLEKICGCLTCPSKSPKIKREKKLPKFGHLRKTDLNTVFGWNQHVRDDEAVKQKLGEIKRQLMEHENEESKSISLSSTKI